MANRHEMQFNVLNFIAGYLNTYGYSPTVREIGAGVGLSSPSTVHGHLDRLERKGFIERNKAQNRGISVTDAGYRFITPLNDAEIELDFATPTDVPAPFEAEINRNTNLFTLQITNDDLIDDHILSGDQLLVQRSTIAKVGALVVIKAVDGSQTVTHYQHGPLLGVVTAVYRDLA